MKQKNKEYEKMNHCIRDISMKHPIKTSELDPTFFEEIKEEEPGTEKLLMCLNCKGCSSSCPVTGVEPAYNIKKLLRMTVLGMRDQVLNSKELWYCTTCYRCQERCPEGVETVGTILKLRSVAVKNGIMLPAHRKIAEYVMRTGHGVPINEKNRIKRKELGLGELPETVHTHPEALSEVRTLLKACEFDRLVGFKEFEGTGAKGLKTPSVT